MPRIAVFCGSRAGNDPAYAEAAAALGRALAGRGCELVYGGAHVGLMGIAADTVLARGGRVTGVIPASMVDRELAHRGVTDLRIVGGMHERKALMASLADAFVVLPGGMGTLDELCEILTWAQLGLHAKPVGLHQQRLALLRLQKTLRDNMVHECREAAVEASDVEQRTRLFM